MKSIGNEKPIYKLSDIVGWSTHLWDRRAAFPFPLLSIHRDLSLYLRPPREYTNPLSSLYLEVLLFILFTSHIYTKKILKKRLDLGILPILSMWSARFERVCFSLVLYLGFQYWRRNWGCGTVHYLRADEDGLIIVSDFSSKDCKPSLLIIDIWVALIKNNRARSVKEVVFNLILIKDALIFKWTVSFYLSTI